MPSRVRDMDFDEVSTVDVPANQHGLIVLTKRAQEAPMPQYFDADGNPIDDFAINEDGSISSSQEFGPGDLIQVLEDGKVTVIELEGEDGGEDQYDGEAQRELQEVGKSAFLDSVNKGGQDVFAALADELSKAVDDDTRDDNVAKAIAAQSAELAKAQRVADEALAKAAKIESAALDQEYIAKAADYGLPVDPNELGPVLKRCAERLSYADQAVLVKALEGSGDIFKSLGIDGEGGLDDDFDDIEAHANAAVSAGGELAKSLGDRVVLSKEQASVAYLDAHPEAYREYRRARMNG